MEDYVMDLSHSPPGIIVIIFFKMANKTIRLIMVMTIYFVSGRYGPCHR